MRPSFFLSIGAVVLGAGISSFSMTTDRVFFIGMLMVIVGVAGLLQWRSARRIDQVNRPADEAYELGYQMGYDRGYNEGHREARPVVVPLHRTEPHELSSSTAMR